LLIVVPQLATLLHSVPGGESTPPVGPGTTVPSGSAKHGFTQGSQTKVVVLHSLPGAQVPEQSMVPLQPSLSAAPH
jgi:hypothetical protein